MREAGSIVVMYHYVRDTEKTLFPDINALSISDFKKQLDYLQSYYEIVDYDSFEERIKIGKPPDLPLAHLTFDDSFVDHYETVFPVLEKHRLSGTFFIADSTIGSKPNLLNVHKTHFLIAKLGADLFKKEVIEILNSMDGKIKLEKKEREGIYRYDVEKDLGIKRLLNYEIPLKDSDYLLETLFKKHIGDITEFARELYLKKRMIQEMRSYKMTFGTHTKNHRVLSRLNRHEQSRELGSGVNTIRKITKQKSIPFCYPYGHKHTYNNDTLKILVEAGYSIAFNTDRRPVMFSSDSPFELPRFDTKDIPPFVAENWNA